VNTGWLTGELRLLLGSTGCALSSFAQSRNPVKGYLLDGRLKKGQVHYLSNRSLYHLAFLRNLFSRSSSTAPQNRLAGARFSGFLRTR
jgi:hypothetical protein